MIGANADKLRTLMYLLVETELLVVDGENFSNIPEANHYLVKGHGSYMGAGFESFVRKTFPNGDCTMVDRKPE